MTILHDGEKYAAFLIFSLITLVSPARAQFAGGSGTFDDPFQIATVEQLQSVNSHLGDHFILINDIDASETVSWNGGAGFQPIGPNPFTGSLDGNRKVIRGLVIYRPQTSDVGLFNRIGTGGEVKRLGLTEASIRGLDQVGGLAAISSGNVTESFVSGHVRGRFTVGGLIGANYGRVSRSFVAADVDADGAVGGLISTSQGHVTDSYVRGSVTQLGRSYSGGLVASIEAGSVKNSFAAVETSGIMISGLGSRHDLDLEVGGYWDTDLSGIPNPVMSGVGVGRTTDEMHRRESFVDFDFSEDGVWAIEENQSYPYLQWQDGVWGHNLSAPREVTAEEGNEQVHLRWQLPLQVAPLGYRVYRDGELITTGSLVTDTTFIDLAVANYTTYQYRVVAVHSLDGQDLESPSRAVAAMPYVIPVGSGTIDDPWQIATAEELSAIRFNPDGHYRLVNDIDLGVAPWNEGEGWEPIPSFSGTLDGGGHIISGLTVDRPGESAGLFSVIAENGIVSRMGLANVNLTGSTAGAFTARILGTLNEVFATGTVRGNVFAGGLAGNSTIGIGRINNSYSICQVQGESVVGLISPATTVSNSYGVGLVEANASLVMPSGSSYWNVDVADSIGAGDGMRTTAELISSATFEGWDFSPEGPWIIEEGVSYPYHKWQGSLAGHNLPAPISVEVEGVTTSNVIRWEPPPSGAELSGYKLYRNGQLVNVDSLLSTTEHHDKDARSDQDYIYYVTSVYLVDGSQLESTPSRRVQGRLAVPFAGGDGSAENPWRITSAEQLHRVRGGLGDHYVLAADIDLGRPPWNADEGWAPIGSYVSDRTHECFTGVFDGAGYSVSGLTIERKGTGTGLFACVKEGVIRNVRLEDVVVKGERFTGSLAGFLERAGHVTGSSATGSVSGTDDTGGLIGSAEYTNTRIDSSSAAVTVSGWNRVGGLLGSASFMGLERVHASGSVLGYEHVGGLVGRMNSSRLIDGYATGDVEGLNAAEGGAGGLVGRASSTRVSGSHASGDVTGKTRVGGLVGATSLGTIFHSYATGAVTADGDEVGGLIGQHRGFELYDVFATGSVHGNSQVGGLLGYNWADETIRRSYAAGSVTGTSKVGGLIGENHRGVFSSYWNREVSGVDVGVGDGRDEGIRGLTTTEMRRSESFEAWPFGSTWTIEEGASYPSLLLDSSVPLETPELLSPEDGSEVTGTVVFEWTGDFRTPRFRLSISQDPAFESTLVLIDRIGVFSYEYSPEVSGTYYWRVTNRDNGWESEVRSFAYIESDATSVAVNELPAELGLGQVYPNPVRYSARLPFQLPEPANVTIELFDLVGRRVSTLKDGQLAAGYHELQLDSRHLSAGVYLYRMTVDKQVFTGKMVVID